jgi:hypothetical protein
LSTGDLEEIVHELDSFAAHLYGGELFRSLYSAAADLSGPSGSASVGFAIRTTPATTRLLAYRPRACAFELLPASEGRAALLAGLECWATDLLAVLRFELPSGYLLAGRYRKWNPAASRLRCDLDVELMLYGHPLRHPARTLDLYRRTVAALGSRIGPGRVRAG